LATIGYTDVPQHYVTHTSPVLLKLVANKPRNDTVTCSASFVCFFVHCFYILTIVKLLYASLTATLSRWQWYWLQASKYETLTQLFTK